MFTRENLTDEVVEKFNELFDLAESLMFASPEMRDTFLEDMAYVVRDLQKIHDKEENEHGYVG